jgi:hypothetical protein
VSDADWIEQAVAKWSQERKVSAAEQSLLAESVRKAYIEQLEPDSFTEGIVKTILARNAALESVLRKTNGRVRHFAGCLSEYGVNGSHCDCGATEIQAYIDALIAKGAGQ